MPAPVALLGLWHETNTFAATPTTLEDFAQFELAAGDEVAQRNAGVGSVIGGFLDRPDLDPRPCFSAGAWPGGPVTEQASRHMLERALEELERIGAVEGVLLNLHGAMYAEDDDDPELRLVRAVRQRLPGVPISAVLDLHANPSAELIASCNAVISYDTYPHIDMRQRGEEAAGLLAGMLADGELLQTSLAKVPLLATPLSQATADQPMKGLQSRAATRAREAGLRRVCVVGGFAYSDVGRAGVSVLVVHRPDQAATASSVLEATVSDIETHAADFVLRRQDPHSAVSSALASEQRPVVLADVADNVGGGSPGDGTALLRELIDQGCTSALLVIADAEVARAAAALGVGATFQGLLGGKTDSRHGSPVKVVARVVGTSDGRYRTEGSWMTGGVFEMGTTAVLDISGIKVVVTERRVPPFHAEQVTSLGLDPRTFEVIVAKGAHAWRAAFGAVAGQVIEVDTPGVCPLDPAVLKRRTKLVRVP